MGLQYRKTLEMLILLYFILFSYNVRNAFLIKQKHRSYRIPFHLLSQKKIGLLNSVWKFSPGTTERTGLELFRTSKNCNCSPVFGPSQFGNCKDQFKLFFWFINLHADISEFCYFNKPRVMIFG